MSRSRWIVILAHGSRDERWRQPFEDLGRQVLARCPDGGVALAYLQLCEPSLQQVLKDCRASGAEEVLVIPAFMSGGGHLLRDVLDRVLQAGKRAGIPVRTTGALVEEPEVMEAMVGAILRLAAG